MIKITIFRFVAITVCLTNGIYYFPQVSSVSGISNLNIIYTFPIVTPFFSLFTCPILATCHILLSFLKRISDSLPSFYGDRPLISTFCIIPYRVFSIPFIHIFILLKSSLTCLWNVLVELAGYSISISIYCYIYVNSGRMCCTVHALIG